MRGIYATMILTLVLMTLAQCQQTSNSWTISGIDLYDSGKYYKAINKGLDLYNQGKYNEAINAYDEAI